MRILVVEDEKEISSFLKKGFERENFAVDVAFDGERGLFLAMTNDYDVMILDLMLPRLNGKQLCQQIRAEGKQFPILILTVKSEISEKVDLLQIGADDYITKPFAFEELLARVRVVLRRPKRQESELLQIDDLVMDVRKHTVIRDGKKISLTRKEFSVLEYLLLHSKEVVSKMILIEHVWDIEANLFSNTIETHIGNLRNKMDKGFGKKLIHTVSRVGYKISDD